MNGNKISGHRCVGTVGIRRPTILTIHSPECQAWSLEQAHPLAHCVIPVSGMQLAGGKGHHLLQGKEAWEQVFAGVFAGSPPHRVIWGEFLTYKTRRAAMLNSTGVNCLVHDRHVLSINCSWMHDLQFCEVSIPHFGVRKLGLAKGEINVSGKHSMNRSRS